MRIAGRWGAAWPCRSPPDRGAPKSVSPVKSFLLHWVGITLLPRLRDRRHGATPHPSPLNLGNIQHPTSNAQHPIPRGEGEASATLGVVYAADSSVLPRLRDRRHGATPHPSPLNLGNIQHPTSNAQHPIPRGEGAASATWGVGYAVDSSVKPKPENRNPKEIRSPKTEKVQPPGGGVSDF